MSVTVRLPRVLASVVGVELVHHVEAGTVGEALSALSESQRALRHHLVDESGALRRHVSVFVDGTQADLETAVGEGAEIQVLQAVSGG